MCLLPLVTKPFLVCSPLSAVSEVSGYITHRLIFPAGLFLVSFSSWQYGLFLLGPVPEFCAGIVERAMSRLNVDASRSLAWAGLEFGIQPREVSCSRGLCREGSWLDVTWRFIHCVVWLELAGELESDRGPVFSSLLGSCMAFMRRLCPPYSYCESSCLHWYGTFFFFFFVCLVRFYFFSSFSFSFRARACTHTHTTTRRVLVGNWSSGLLVWSPCRKWMNVLNPTGPIVLVLLLFLVFW